MPMASSAMAVTVAERMRKAVESHWFSVREEQMVGLGISLGVACFPDDTENVAELIKSADHALYQAKRQGRNAVGTR